jgi:cytochrome c551/c552
MGGQASSTAGTTGGAVGSTQTANLPCDVAAIVNERCITCHTSPTRFGAPMPLLTAADFRAAAEMSTQSVADRVLTRIADNVKPMPPPPNPRLSAAEISTFTSWINAGAPDGTCSSSGVGGTGGAAGSGAGPAAGSGGSTELPDDVTCYNITARNSAAGDKYSVPTTPDLYECFNYAPPWGDKEVQIVSSEPIIDNSQVLHHWILYNGAAAVTDGGHADCIGAHPNAAFVNGWAPGSPGMHLPDDVGLGTEGDGFVLEIHYNNKAGAGQVDASGVKLCVTEKLRPNVAAVHWLGTQNLNKTTATGSCVPINTQPVTIISSSPHMHLQGRHLTTVINRKSGATDMLIDQPFDFNTQISYQTPAVIQPGDTLTTTCTYASPTPFGESTNDEMCYNFVVAYPAGQLAQFLQLLRKYDCTGL